MERHHAVTLARAASHGSLLYGAAAIGTVSLMADINADKALGHVLAWRTLGFKGYTHQPRTHRTAMVSLGITPTASLHIKARCTMLWGILAAGTNTPAFAVLMISIMHALPSLPVDATPAAQIPVLLRADAAACEAGSHPAWTPAFLRMAAELRLLGLPDLVTALIEYATRWTAADGATRQRMVAPIPPRLGNKEPRLVQLPPARPFARPGRTCRS